MNQKIEEKVEEKTPAQLRQEQRDKIESVKSENDLTKDDEENVENEDDKDDEGEKEEEKEENKEKELEKEEDDEDEKEEDDPAKLKKAIERLKRRIGTKTNSEKELAKKLADAEAKLKAAEDEKGEKLLTEEDVEARAKKLAEDTVFQQKFDASCARLEEAALKTNPDFTDEIKELGEDYGAIPFHMIEILDDLERGGEVLNHLIKNPDEYEKIRKFTPGKMASKLKDIDIELKPKKDKKEISKAPTPPKPVQTNNAGNNDIVLTGKESMDDWVRKRNEQIARKRGMR